LNEIGADESADNVLYLEELLRPTFEPTRLDLREPWEQRNPLEARRWLRKSLGDLKRKNGGEKHIVLPYKENDEQAQAELFAFAQEESKRAREAEIRSILPERQYQILMLLVEERKQAEIAEELGIGLSTVKTHAGRLRRNPDLLRALQP
jgi:DNA-directed RNA polymerase specialized sigma24 family protein